MNIWAECTVERMKWKWLGRLRRIGFCYINHNLREPNGVSSMPFIRSADNTKCYRIHLFDSAIQFVANASNNSITIMNCGAETTLN